MTAVETPEALSAFVTWGGAVLIAFAIVSGIAGFAVWVGRHMDKRIASIAEQLDNRTQPIQSGYENDGNSLTDISNKMKAVGREIGDLRAVSESNQELLKHKIDVVSERLDEHAASPEHNRRSEGERTRKNDNEEQG